MNLNFPFFRYKPTPPYRTHLSKNSIHSGTLHTNTNTTSQKNSKDFSSSKATHQDNGSNITEERHLEDREFLDIFGIRLYYDDILLISLIFFLYQEGVDDTELFIALIMLLLN